tara:strand:+ start:3366 stop:7250 length:3885 start_codon:yes stop_codon:yes gene_type:complete
MAIIDNNKERNIIYTNADRNDNSVYSAREYDESNFFENLSDVFENHFWDEQFTEFKALGNTDPDFNFGESVSELYPDLVNNDSFIENLSRANSVDQLKVRGDNIRSNLQSKQNLSHANFGYHLMMDMLAYTVSDPLMLTPIGARKWAYQPLKSTWYKYGATGMATIAPYEFARVSANPIIDPKEALYTIPTAGVLMSAVGPALGRIFKGVLDDKAVKEIVEDTKWQKPFDNNDYLSLKFRAKDLDDNNIIIKNKNGIPIREPKPTEEPLSVPLGGSGYQATRKVLTKPYGLDQSEYDLIKDIGLLWSNNKSFMSSVSNNDINFVLDIADEIASDMSTMMASNLTRSTPASVDTLYKRNWYSSMYDARAAIDNGWAKIINLPGRVEGSPDVSQTFQGLNRKVSAADMSDWRARKTKGFLGTKQKISKKKFQRLVATEILRPNKKSHPAVKEAAKEITKIYEKFGKAIDEAGLSYGEQNIKRSIDRLTKRLERLEEVKLNKYTNKDIKTRIKDTKEEIATLKSELDELKLRPFGSTKTSKNYFPLFWNVSKIRRNKEEVIRLLTNEFQREMPSGAKKRATETVNRMIREEGHFEGTSMTGKSMTNLMSRKLDIKDDWFLKYIELDTEIVIRNYIKRMGTHIEMAKLGDGDRRLTNKLDGIKEKFGNMRKGINDNKSLSVAERKKLTDELDIQEYQVLDSVESLRDRVLGTFVSGEQIHSYSARSARVLKNMGVLALAGKFTINSTADLGTLALHYNMKNSFGTMFQRMLGPQNNPAIGQVFQSGKRDAKLFGSAFDTVMHSANARMMEFDGVIPGQNTRFESFLEDNANRMFKFNMLNYWTTMNKELATVLSVDTIIKDSVRLAGLYKKNGNTITNDVANDWVRLRSQGLKDSDILSIGNNTGGVKWKRVEFKSNKVLEEHKEIGWIETSAKMTEDDYKYVADTDGWTNTGIAERFGTAVHTDVNMSVMTPSIATRPGWLDGMWKGVPHSKKFAKEKKKAQENINRLTSNVQTNLGKLRKLGIELDNHGSPDKYYKFLKELVDHKNPNVQKIANDLQNQFKEIDNFKDRYTTISRKYKPLLSLFFQFRTFGISAASKITLPTIQGRARYPMQGALALVTLAYFSQYAKNPQSFLNKDFGEQFLTAMEYSGMSNWLVDFNNTMETLTEALGNQGIGPEGGIGIRPAFNMDEKYTYDSDEDALGSLAGTPFVVPLNILQAITGQTLGGGSLSDRERIKMLYRILPFNNLFLLDLPFNLPGSTDLLDAGITAIGGNNVDNDSKKKRLQRKRRNRSIFSN